MQRTALISPAVKLTVLASLSTTSTDRSIPSQQARDADISAAGQSSVCQRNEIQACGSCEKLCEHVAFVGMNMSRSLDWNNIIICWRGAVAFV